MGWKDGLENSRNRTCSRLIQVLIVNIKRMPVRLHVANGRITNGAVRPNHACVVLVGEADKKFDDKFLSLIEFIYGRPDVAMTRDAKPIQMGRPPHGRASWRSG